MKTKQLADFDADGIFEIPRQSIHPDPDQPRVKPDAELQASIDAQGIIQAITVRPHPQLEDEWMIVDGERRFLGAAHLKTIPCRIRLDLEDSVDRLIIQLSANTGKPLTPIEQARAFKKALDADPKFSQAKLAEALGIPRSTIGDRIRLIELHPAWLKLIESGRLQVSHAPLIHQYRAVPDEYQEKAAAHVRDVRADDVIRVADMRKELYRAFRDFVIRMDRVRGYKGPVIEVEEESYSYGGTKLRKVKYAADIKLWRPIRNAAERRRKKEHGISGGSSPSFARRKSLIDEAEDLIAGRVKVKTSSSWNVKPGPGETEIFSESGWSEGLDPEVLSAQLGVDDLIIRAGQGERRKIFTTNSRAVELAQNSFEEKLLAELEPNLKKVKAKLTPELLAANTVSGPGIRWIVATILTGDEYDAEVQTLHTVALAVANCNLPNADLADYETRVPSLVEALKQYPLDTLSTILSAYSAALASKTKLPDLFDQRQAIATQTSEAKFSFRDAAPPKSKKQQKREARAAGQQVGDPSRAKKETEVPIARDVDVDEMRAAVEAGAIDSIVETEEHAELVEA